jgi:hypothetical protein
MDEERAESRAHQYIAYELKLDFSEGLIIFLGDFRTKTVKLQIKFFEIPRQRSFERFRGQEMRNVDLSLVPSQFCYFHHIGLSEAKDVDAEVLLIDSCLSQGGALAEDLGDVARRIEDVEFVTSDKHGERRAFCLLAGRNMVSSV